MDFFAAQDQARRRTRILVVLFGLAILAIVLVIYVPANLVLGAGPEGHDPRLFAQIALPVAGFILAGTWWRLRTLRAGGPTVAALMGARPVAPDSASAAEARLINIVEELALASGIPVPAVYVLEREEAINAFAAGYSIHDAAVVVTKGCMERLDRDELQGVMAHEFSHILNGDMRLNIRTVGVLYGLVLLTVTGRGILRTAAHTGRRKDNAAGGAIAIGLALVIVGYLGVFFGKLIKAAISRQREYLADAAAVQFTRNPHGLAGALKKIATLLPGSVIHDHHAEELSHVFFASGLRQSGLGLPLFTTHPPIERRIRRIDPAWDGSYDVAVPESMKQAAETARAERVPGMGVPPMARRGLSTAAVMASIGAPAAVHLAYARDLLGRIPPALRSATHDETGAQALVLALLLSSESGPVREQQLEAITADGGPALARRTVELETWIARVGAEARLGLLDLALPTLHHLPEPRAVAFRRTVQRLIREDNQVRMFDYALVHILARHLRPGRGRDAAPGEHFHSFQPLREDVEVVLSVVAHSGATAAREAEAAFGGAADRLPPTAHPLALRQPECLDLPRVDRALQRLERASLGVRRRLVDAAAHCVAFDGRVLPEEAETLRAVAEALECPLPPVSAAFPEAVPA
jgi:Zn-dependent protease with chaperone function